MIRQQIWVHKGTKWGQRSKSGAGAATEDSMRADFFAAVHWRSEIPKIDKIHLTKKINTFHNGGKYIGHIGQICTITNLYRYIWASNGGIKACGILPRSSGGRRFQELNGSSVKSVFLYLYLYLKLCLCICIFEYWSEQSGQDFFVAVQQWRSEIPRIQWIIRQMNLTQVWDQIVAETKKTTMNHQSVIKRLLPWPLPGNRTILEICNDWFIDGCCQPYSAILVFDKRLI